MRLLMQRVVILSLGICTLSNQALAQQNQIKTVTPLQLIQAADLALLDKQKEIDAQQEVITKLKKDLADAITATQQCEDRKNRWYHNPVYDIPIGAGLALGAAVNPVILITVPLIALIGIFGG